MEPPKDWQLFKRDLKTNEVSKAYPSWTPMTHREAIQSRWAHEGCRCSEVFHYFEAKISEFPNLC